MYEKIQEYINICMNHNKSCVCKYCEMVKKWGNDIIISGE